MKLLTILLLVVISAINCSKILFIIPCLTNSVVIQSGRLADLLVEDGHDVVSFYRLNEISRYFFINNRDRLLYCLLSGDILFITIIIDSFKHRVV